VKRNISKKLAKRKRKIEKQVKNRNWQDQPKPMMAGGNIVYDFDGRNQAIANGGIGTIHQLAARSGLIDESTPALTFSKGICRITNPIISLTSPTVIWPVEAACRTLSCCETTRPGLTLWVLKSSPIPPRQVTF
jgi:hypothetical protein